MKSSSKKSCASKFGLKDPRRALGGIGGLLWRSTTEQCTHQPAQIEARDVDQLALGSPAQPDTAHPAAVQRVSEAALDQFAAQAHCRAPDARSQPPPIGVNRLARRLVAKPFAGAGSAMRVFQAPPSSSLKTRANDRPCPPRPRKGPPASARR